MTRDNKLTKLLDKTAQTGMMVKNCTVEGHPSTNNLHRTHHGQGHGVEEVPVIHTLEDEDDNTTEGEGNGSDTDE